MMANYERSPNGRVPSAKGLSCKIPGYADACRSSIAFVIVGIVVEYFCRCRYCRKNSREARERTQAKELMFWRTGVPCRCNVKDKTCRAAMLHRKSQTETEAALIDAGTTTNKLHVKACGIPWILIRNATGK